jgi:hypothetical protein
LKSDFLKIEKKIAPRFPFIRMVDVADFQETQTATSRDILCDATTEDVKSCSAIISQQLNLCSLTS